MTNLTIMSRTKVREFNSKLTDERLNGHTRYEKNINDLYREIINAMASSYDVYHDLIPDFLHSLETNRDNSLPYSLALFFELYDELLSHREFSAFDLSAMDYEPDENTLEMMAPMLEDSYKKIKYSVSLRLIMTYQISLMLIRRKW